MTNRAKVLGIQIQPVMGDKAANLDKVRKFADEYAWCKPDLIVLPEVFNIGVDHKELRKLAEPIPDGITTQTMIELAKKHNTNVIAGSYIELLPDGDYRNACVVINRQGEIIGKYHKIHLFNYQGSEESKFVSPGNKAVIVQTDIGKIGLTICYDIRFPELYRTLNEGGAEIITNVAAFANTKYDHWVTLNKARAIENLVYVISVNQCGRVDIKRQNLGMSMVINPWGDVIASAGTNEGVMMAEIDLGTLRKTREEFSVLNDRVPAAYTNPVIF